MLCDWSFCISASLQLTVPVSFWLVCRFYKDFIDKVAAGRNMRAEEVARVAKGRIWTGRDAYQLGLVDELGGLTKAIALAKQMAELPQVTTPRSFCRSHIVAGLRLESHILHTLRSPKLLCIVQSDCHQLLLIQMMVVL